jgi:hypothetical protein
LEEMGEVEERQSGLDEIAQQAYSMLLEENRS